MSREMSDSLQKMYLTAIDSALRIGGAVLAEGGQAIEAVEKTVRYLEDNPNFNAGRGSVLNAEGQVEMDASIMSGKDLSCGAVAGVRTVKNPISLARLVMERTKHVLLVTSGAELFADKMGVERRDSSYFIIPSQLENLRELKSKKGTVGAVALDRRGNLAAATSTGGLAGKMPGRVGDSPIISAGTYADNKTCAVSCTGVGEQFIRNAVAFRVSALMEMKNYSLQNAVNEIVYHVLKPNDGGLISVDKDGNYCMEFNTRGMFRGVINSNSEPHSYIYK